MKTFSNVRRSMMGAIVAAPWVHLSGAVASDARAWKPSKPITLVVPFAPGGGTDNSARAFSGKLQELLGQSVVVDNRSGAAGMIGSRSVFQAPPDGYTLLAGTSDTMVVGPLVYTNLPYQTSDFSFVRPLTAAPMALVGKKGGPQNLRELVETAKKSQINYGHWGFGAIGYVALEMFKHQAGLASIQGVPYRGAGPSVQAVMAGEVDITLIDLGIALANQERLTIFGVASAQRSRIASHIPTMSELGYPLNFDVWFGVVAPPRTPKPILDAFHHAIALAAREPAVSKRLLDAGYDTTGFESKVLASPDGFGTFVAEEVARVQPVVQRTGVRLTI